MLELVRRYLSRPPAASEKRESGNILIATCALLLEMASADGEFSYDELVLILSILEKDYGLGREEAEEMLKAAQAEREKSIDLWQFTSLINRNYSEEEKINIMEIIWKVIYTDGRLDGHEDYLVHHLATLLRLSHTQMIEAKLRAKEAKNDSRAETRRR
jgi:uncharacterized tellurite resistance protein B-like protein